MNIVSATITGSLILNGVNISSITGSESSINALNSFTASAATTGSNQFNGNQTVTGSVNITGSLIVTGSIIGTVTTASYVLNAVSASYALVATTSSYALVAATSSFADIFTVAGTLTAQKLVVQTITSSIVYSSGSNIFGNSISDTQSMTGSVGISGSLAVTGAATFTGTVTATTGTTGTAIKLSGATNYGLIQDANSVSRIWFENTGSYRTIFDLPSSGTSFVFRDYSGNIGASISSAGAATFAGKISTSHSTSGDYAAVFYNTSATGEGVTVRGGSTSSHNAFIVQPYNGATTLFSILATGAATFSSSVSVNTTNAVSVLEIGAVESDGTGSTNALRIQSKTGASNQQLLIGVNQTGTYSFLQSSQASVGYKPLSLNPNGGNVGINLTAPKTLLSINAGSGAYPTLGTNVTNSFFVSRDDGFVGMYLGYAADGNGWIQQMRNDVITAYNLILQPVGGNVGIGTTSPAALLDVKQPTLAIASTFQAWAPGVAGATFKVISTTGQPYMQYDFNNGNVGIGTTNPLGKLTTFGGAVQFIGDYNNHHTIIKSTGNQGTFNGSLVITIPEMSTASGDGYGGFSCEVYVAGYSGMYCHVWFSGYINGGITASEAAILRSNGGWSVSQATSGTYNQGFTFTIDYPNSLIHPTARIIFNKGGNLSATAYPANSITAVWS